MVSWFLVSKHLYLYSITTSENLQLCMFCLKLNVCWCHIYSFHSAGPLIILACSLKMLRFAFSDTPRQYLIIAFTYFFFKYDFRWSSETFLVDYFFISILFCKVSNNMQLLKLDNNICRSCIYIQLFMFRPYNICYQRRRKEYMGGIRKWVRPTQNMEWGRRVKIYHWQYLFMLKKTGKLF